VTINNINKTTPTPTGNNVVIQQRKFKFIATIFGKYEDKIEISFTNKSINIKVNPGTTLQKKYQANVNFDKFNPKETLKAILVISSVIDKVILSESDKIYLKNAIGRLKDDFKNKQVSLRFSTTNLIDIKELHELGIELKDIIVRSKGPVSFQNPLPGPFAESAERLIGSVVMTENNKNEFSQEYNKDMQTIATLEGFKLQIIQTKISINPEDSQVVLSDSSRVTPISKDVFAEIKNAYGYSAPTYFTDKQHVDYHRGMGSAMDGVLAKDMKQLNQDSIKEGKSYFEGGNILTATSTDNSKVIIIGASSFDINNAIFRTNYVTYNELLEAKTVAGQTGIREIINQKTFEMMATDLNIRPEQMLFIPQMGLHIDTYLRPGLNGEIFINDWGTSVKLLTALLKLNNLSAEEKNYYSSFLEHAQAMGKKHENVYKETYKKLTEYGFTVIKVPGVFYSKKTLNLPAKHINFMNGVMGTGNSGTFYITNGSNFPRLNNIVASIFKHFGINNIYFTGRSLDSFSFDPAEKSLLKFDSGVDCRTLEFPKDDNNK